MDIYHYHPVSGEYVGKSVADPSPLEPGKYLIPAHATDAVPPTPGDGQVAVWAGTAWVVKTPIPPADDAPVVPAVPTVVTMRQARLALLQQGLLASVEAAIASAGQAAQIEWEYAQGVEVDSPLVEAMRDVLGLTDDDVLGLFAIAGGL